MTSVAMNNSLAPLSILIVFCLNSVSAISSHPLILIISFDGFRRDYLNASFTPNLFKLRSEGTYTDHMINVFPTKTYTNHHSILTGLYAEQHGVLDNSIYDEKLKKTIGYSEELFVKDGVWPITILNEAAGKRRYSGSMMWPGTDFKYNGYGLTHRRLFKINMPWEERVDEVITWFLDEKKPANLVTMYFSEPDTWGHMTGVNTEEVRQQISRCDAITKYLVKKLDESKLLQKINLFFLSDHGMASVEVKHLINLLDYIDEKDVIFGGSSPIIHVHPVPGKSDEIYERLKTASQTVKKFDVYKKADIPDRWKFKSNERAPPILVVAKINCAFHDLWEHYRWFQEYNRKVTKNSVVGLHGYDNMEPIMWPFFFASGPLIKKCTEIAPFNNIDLFELWSHILKVSTKKKSIHSSGNLKNVQGMLVASNKSLIVSAITGAFSNIVELWRKAFQKTKTMRST